LSSLKRKIDNNEYLLKFHNFFVRFLKLFKMEKFRELGLIEPILRVIKKEGFEKPTEIQEKTIPLVLEGKDVVAESATGSGKTLAFSVGILQSSLLGKGIQALILSPTRELAHQISDELNKFSKHRQLKTALIYGGVSINPQISALRKADVVVATPGRLLDHLSRGTVNLSRVSTVILDEADRMFDMGFIDDIREILSHCPTKRQTLLFSATISDDVMLIAKKYMHNPTRINAGKRVDPTKLKQVYYDVDSKLKFPLLVNLLNAEKTGLVMIFCNTRVNVDFVASNLKALGINATAIHGGFSQDKRTKTMTKFHSKSVHVLVCTDVAGRGLDVKGVSHVYNYDIPNESKQYIHRIGRTARAGEEGNAITILSRRDYENFTRVLDEQRVKIRELALPKIERVEITYKSGSRSDSRGGSRSGSRGNFGPRGSGSRGGSRERSAGRGSRGRSFGRSRDSSEENSAPRGRSSSGRGSSSRGGYDSERGSSSSRSRSPRSGSGSRGGYDSERGSSSSRSRSPRSGSGRSSSGRGSGSRGGSSRGPSSDSRGRSSGGRSPSRDSGSRGRSSGGKFSARRK
jgi:ATP-dependent RNA helicase DeaD